MSLFAILNFPESHSAFTKVYGLTILERTLRALERSDVKEVFLISEKNASQIKALLNKVDAFDLKVNYAESIQDVYANLEAPFFYIHEPLVIDPNLLKEMMSESAESNCPVLIEHKVLFIPNSKFSPSFNDFDNLQNWVNKDQFPKKHKSTEGRVFGIVTDRKSKNQIEKILIQSLTKPTDGWVSRNLNRPISTLVSRVLAHTSITPNQFTIFTGFIGLATGYFLALGGYWYYLIGGFLFHLTSILDGVDGELARLKFKSSPFGQWLDTLVDNLSYLAALAGIVYGVYVNGASDFVKMSGFLAVIFAVSALASLYFYLLRFKAGGSLLNVEYSFQNGTTTYDKIMRTAGLFGKRDLFALIFFFLGIIGQMPLALTYVAIMAFFVFAFSIQAHFKGSKK